MYTYAYILTPKRIKINRPVYNSALKLALSILCSDLYLLPLADHSFGWTWTISYPIIHVQYALDGQASLQFIDYKLNSTFALNYLASIPFKRSALQSAIAHKCDYHV